MTPPSSFLQKLVRLQVERPIWVLAIAAAITALAIGLATRLTVLTGFEYLLPTSRPSVAELHRVAAKTGGVSTLFVVLKSPDDGPPPREALRHAGDKVVTELAALGPPWVGSVEDGVEDAYHFLLPRSGLYASLETLEKLRDDVQARYDYEISKAMDTDFGDPPPPIDNKTIKARLGGNGFDEDRFPDGYYQSKDGRTLVVAIRSQVMGSDVERGTEALRKVEGAIARVNLASYDPRITYGFAGDLYSGVAEVSAIHADLTAVGLLGALLIGGVVLLYYLRIRTLVAMLATIVVGVAWTFGVTEVAIGHLNMASGFLFTIVAGNGINFAIIYMARYLETRRRGASLAESISVAHRETWVATLCAAVAAAASYGSLVLTDFRGFHDFGIIGGMGMVLCWIATYWTLPALLAVLERIVPINSRWGRERPQTPADGVGFKEATGAPGLLSTFRNAWEAAFGRPFAAIVPLAPRAIATVGIALAVLGIAGIARYVANDPMEYDLDNLRNDRHARADEEHDKSLADAITGYVGADGMAILVDRPDQVKPLRAALYARRDAAPPELRPFKDVHALQDFIPEEQDKKIPVLLDLATKARKAQKRGFITDADWKEISPLLPPADLKAFGIEDLPAGAARAFTETDGTRGRIVYISPTAPRLTEDAHYLLRWADSYRETRLPDGSVVLGSGRAVIYADMWAAVEEAVPRAVLFSFLATVLVVVFAFRGGRAPWLVVGALLVGVGWLAAMFVLLKIKLNFLNFIALPITFGIGVDYAVNIVHRHARGGAEGALTAVRETGGAVVLCSLTTMLGYVALIRSMNFGVRSLGIAAVMGEACCVLAAVLVLPAGLVWLERRRANRAAEAAAPPLELKDRTDSA